jgi:hypothetical protein
VNNDYSIIVQTYWRVIWKQKWFFISSFQTVIIQNCAFAILIQVYFIMQFKNRLQGFRFCHIMQLATRYPDMTMRRYTTLVEMFPWRHHHDWFIFNHRNIFIENTCQLSLIPVVIEHRECTQPLFAVTTLALLCSILQWITLYPSNDTSIRINIIYTKHYTLNLYSIILFTLNNTIKQKYVNSSGSEHCKTKNN